MPQPMQNFSCVVVVVVVLSGFVVVVVYSTMPDTALGGRPPPSSVLNTAAPENGLIAYAVAVPRSGTQVPSGSFGLLVEKKMYPLTASGALTAFSPTANV